MNIPVCVPVVPRNAKKYVDMVIDRNWVSSSCLDEEVNYIKKLEEGFSGYCGVKYGTAVTNGSTALVLALATLGLNPGSDIILPTFTMIATASAVIQNGCNPIFVDADPETWCMDVKLVEAAVTENTKAIIPVHIYGYPCDMDGIIKIAEKYGLFIVEDAAEAIGTEYKGKKAGSMGDIGCFSFYANKIITSGEGGVVITDNLHHYERAAMLKNQGFGEPRFIHEEIGFNFRMNNLTAAYAYASLEEIDEYVDRRIKSAEYYYQGLSGIDGITLPTMSSGEVKNSYWMFGILVEKLRYGMSKDELRKTLKAEYGIDTRDFFYPMHKQPAIVRKGYVREDTSLPVSERLWSEGLYLPSSTNITETELDYIVDTIKKIHRNCIAGKIHKQV